MKINYIKTAVLASSLFASSLALADTVAVKAGAAFLIGGPTLSVQPLKTGLLPTQACLDQLAAHPINLAATDIVISGKKAIVAPGPTLTTADVVDISACLSEDYDNDQYEAKYDVKKGKVTVPCLNLNGTFYNAVMKQQGKSRNWEVSLGNALPAGSCIN